MADPRASLEGGARERRAGVKRWGHKRWGHVGVMEALGSQRWGQALGSGFHYFVFIGAAFTPYGKQ